MTGCLCCRAVASRGRPSLARRLTDQRDVGGVGFQLQTGPQLGLAGGQSGRHGDGAQTLIGRVIINQQRLTQETGEQVRGQRSEEQKGGWGGRGKTGSPGRIRGHRLNPEDRSEIQMWLLHSHNAEAGLQDRRPLLPDVAHGDGASPVLEGLVQLQDTRRQVGLKEQRREVLPLCESGLSPRRPRRARRQPGSAPPARPRRRRRGRRSPLQGDDSKRRMWFLRVNLWFLRVLAADSRFSCATTDWPPGVSPGPQKLHRDPPAEGRTCN